MARTLTCGSCGVKGLVRFSGESRKLTHGEFTETVENLSGWRCPACDEILFDADSARRYAAASDSLVLRSRQSDGVMLKNARVRLKLTQKEAGELAGGGVNAFSRYETGKVRPLPAVVHLFRLLGAHPHLLQEIQQTKPATATASATVAHKMGKKRSDGAKSKLR